MTGSIEFGELSEDGYVHVRSLPRTAVGACAHLIMTPEHYREDDTCRCDDATHVEMAEWGYGWSDGRWRAYDQPDGYTYDPELSDERTPGFVNVDGEQWYAPPGTQAT